MRTANPVPPIRPTRQAGRRAHPARRARLMAASFSLVGFLGIGTALKVGADARAASTGGSTARNVSGAAAATTTTVTASGTGSSSFAVSGSSSPSVSSSRAS